MMTLFFCLALFTVVITGSGATVASGSEIAIPAISNPQSTHAGRAADAGYPKVLAFQVKKQEFTYSKMCP